VRDIGQGTFNYTCEDVDVLADGRIVVADSVNNSVCILSHEGELLHRLGTGGYDDGQFEHPTSLVVHLDKLFVLDLCWGRVQVFH